MSNFGFIKKFRSQKAKDLKRKHTSAFLILDTLAENAKRDSSDPLLKLGEGIVTAEECGISSQQFETGIKYLVSKDYVEVIHRGRKDHNSKLLLRVRPESTPDSIQIKARINGTVLRLIDTEIYDINIIDAPNHIPNQTRINSEFTPNKQEVKKKELKKDHHPYPSSKVSPLPVDEGLMTDDFFSKNSFQEEDPTPKPFTSLATALPVKPPMQHNIYAQTRQKDSPKIQVLPDVFLTQEDLDACIAIKGSLESVQHAIGYVLKSPGRKYDIYNWPSTLATWVIKNDIKTQMQENQEMAKRLEKEYGEYTQGWSCRIYHDKVKDWNVLLFESQSSYVEPVSFPLVDKDFKEKVSKFIRDKKMQRGRISKS